MLPAMPAHDTVATPVPTGNTYDKYTATNPIERQLMAGFLGALDRCLPEVAPARVLEVGMGEGEIAARVRHRYPGASLVGVDLPDAELASAWRGHHLDGAFADIVDLPFPSLSFDLVLAIEVLEHVPDAEAALAELARVGRGTFVVSVPREPIWRIANMARGKYIGDLGNTPGHIQHWSHRSFRRLVGSHFDIVTTRTPLPWTMVAARNRAGCAPARLPCGQGRSGRVTSPPGTPGPPLPAVTGAEARDVAAAAVYVHVQMWRKPSGEWFHRIERS